MRHLWLLLLLWTPYGQAADLFTPLAGDDSHAYAVSGVGMVTDDGHPWHPGDVREYPMTLRLSYQPQRGEAKLVFGWESDGEGHSEAYYYRRGRVFQIAEDSTEVPAGSFGDLPAATVAALHPLLVNCAVRERRDNIRAAGPGDYLFAWNDELWEVAADTADGSLVSLLHKTYHDLLGDGREVIQYERPNADSVIVHVTAGGRTTARFAFGAVSSGPFEAIPDGDRKRDRSRMIAADEIDFRNIDSGIHVIDLASMNTRVVAAEFSDYLVILEGVYNSRICDLVAQAVARRFDKPVRYHSFSHLHHQYIGGVRSWTAAGAEVIAPPTTVPYVERILASTHSLRPDALSRRPEPARCSAVAEKLVLEDSSNRLEVYNVESQHTDEYLIFYFPKQRLLMTGDLLFFREGQPLRGRSKKLCETVADLGLDVDTYLATWPLDGYGTKNAVTGDEMAAACAASE